METNNPPLRRLALLALVVALVPLLVSAALPPTKPTNPTRHEYRHSLRRPFYVHPPALMANGTTAGSAGHHTNPDDAEDDPTTRVLPYFAPYGAAGPGPADLSLRLVPAVPRARGAVVSTIALRPDPSLAHDGSALPHGVGKGWEVRLAFKMAPNPNALQAAVTGRASSAAVPGVGLAVWLTSIPVSGTGPQASGNFGAEQVPFDGLQISVMPEPSALHPNRVRIEGLVAFEMAGQKINLGSCVADLRKPDSEAAISILYLDESQELEVWTDATGVHLAPAWEACMRTIIQLPTRGGFLAVTAANGEMDRTDDIDITALDVLAYDPPAKPPRAIKTGTSSIKWTPPDEKTKEHIHDIEEKVHKLQQDSDNRRLQDALAKANAKAAGSSDTSAAGPGGAASVFSPSPLAGSATAGTLIGIDAQIKQLSADLAALRAATAASAASSSSNTGSTLSSVVSIAGFNPGDLVSWQRSMDARLDRLESTLSLRHADLLAQLTAIEKAVGATVASAASVAPGTATRDQVDQLHAVLREQKQAAIDSQKDQIGWLGMFGLSIAAQVIGLIAWNIYKAMRGGRGEEHKKFL
ncbi:hypothetical protein BC828DRAFT_279426 [Blastocladiella britannica]|nr:hypothetical protein BC828DRAFT_279426 [Blastocladiella britannica]